MFTGGEKGSTPTKSNSIRDSAVTGTPQANASIETNSPSVSPASSTTANSNNSDSKKQPVSLSNPDKKPAAVAEVDPKKLAALAKIQRFVKNSNAKKKAREEENWKIFAGLDTLEEAEMLQLASFMSTLMEKIPHNNSKSPRSEMKMDDYDEDVAGTIVVESADASTAGKPRKSFDFGNNKTAPISLDIAKGVIDMVRSKQKLSANTVMKLLRRTYASLKASGNTRKLSVPPGGKVNVVGDLHGQLPDLLHILDEAGLPSDTNKYVFNGDFVDRGEQGLEITCILMSLFLAEPNNVVLNRGNHEDAAITRVYGFQDECINKYDELTYGMFSEVFRYLPLFVVINDSIFIVHGGLFNNRAVTLADLDKINRIDYVARPPVPYPQCLEGLDNEGQWIEYFKQLQRDALWSDPQADVGLVESERGAGVCFGPDVSKTFMDNNNLSMIIRSHECVRRGFFLPYANTAAPAANPPGTPLLCTVFSASNYGDGDNEGAYIVVMDHKHSNAAPIKESGLFYSVRHFKINGDADLSAAPKEHRDTKSTLQELILKKKAALEVQFETIDTGNTGIITRAQWAEIMLKVTNVQIRWLGLLSQIAAPDSLTPTTVDYRKFLSTYSVKPKNNSKAANDKDNSKLLDAMYAQRKKLEAVFTFFDTNGDGVISPQEFRTGCDFLNENLPEKQRLTDIDHMLAMMDFDGNGEVDINEFFETFRILDERMKK